MSFFSFLSNTFDESLLSVQLDDCHILLPSSVPFSSLDSRLEYSDADESGSNILGYVHYSYEGVEVGVSALRLISRIDDNASVRQPLPGTPGSASHAGASPDAGSGTAPLVTAADETGTGETLPDGSPMEVRSDSGTEKKIITVNVWHLCGYIFLAVLAVLIAGLLIHHYSPKQRRIRKTRQMRRIYISGERKKKKKRRELR